MSTNPLFEAWLESLDEGWWDDAGDAGTILDSLQDAFEAGQHAERQRPQSENSDL